MAFVLIQQAQRADDFFISFTEHFEKLVVLWAGFLLEVSKGGDELVFLEGSRLMVRLQVNVTVRGQTRQTGLRSFVLLTDAGITLHVFIS